MNSLNHLKINRSKITEKLLTPVVDYFLINGVPTFCSIELTIRNGTVFEIIEQRRTRI